MARIFVAFATVVGCILWGVSLIAGRPTVNLDYATRPPSQENLEFVSSPDYVDNTGIEGVDNETDEWNAALDPPSTNPIFANDQSAAAASSDTVSRLEGRHLRRRSVSRVRRTLSWDDACRGEDAVTVDDDFEEEYSVTADTESNRILRLNETIRDLRYRLFADALSNYVSRRQCSRRRRLSTGGQNPTRPSAANGTEEQEEDVMCQLNNKLKRVAYLTKLINDSETIYAQDVVRSRTILDELDSLALYPYSGIYVNLCLVQQYAQDHSLMCRPQDPSNSPGGSSYNPSMSRDERFAYNCDNLREIGSLLNRSVELIRQEAERAILM